MQHIIFFQLKLRVLRPSCTSRGYTLVRQELTKRYLYTDFLLISKCSEANKYNSKTFIFIFQRFL